jgi:integrase
MSFLGFFTFPTKAQKGTNITPSKRWIIDPRTCFTLPEVQQLFQAAELRKTTSKSGMKDWCYVVLSLNTGLRISEVAALCCKHVVLEGAVYPHVFVEKGKTEHSRRRVPLNTNTVEALLEYKRFKATWGEPWSDEEPLLRSPSGGHYTRWALFDGFKRTLLIAKGIVNPERFHPHSMRHSFGTFLYKASGYNLRLVQELLGHSSIRVSEVYTTVFSEERTAAVEKLYQDGLGKKG